MNSSPGGSYGSSQSSYMPRLGSPSGFMGSGQGNPFQRSAWPTPQPQSGMMPPRMMDTGGYGRQPQSFGDAPPQQYPGFNGAVQDMGNGIQMRQMGPSMLPPGLSGAPQTGGPSSMTMDANGPQWGPPQMGNPTAPSVLPPQQSQSPQQQPLTMSDWAAQMAKQNPSLAGQRISAFDPQYNFFDKNTGAYTGPLPDEWKSQAPRAGQDTFMGIKDGGFMLGGRGAIGGASLGGNLDPRNLSADNINQLNRNGFSAMAPQTGPGTLNGATADWWTSRGAPAPAGLSGTQPAQGGGAPVGGGVGNPQGYQPPRPLTSTGIPFGPQGSSVQNIRGYQPPRGTMQPVNQTTDLRAFLQQLLQR